MGKLHLEIVTPEKVLVSREVDMVVAPGTEGEFGVLPGHIPFLSGLVPGELRYTSGAEKDSLVVTAGFSEVSDNRVSILVDAAEKALDIDLDRARSAKGRADGRLGKGRSSPDIEFARAEAALQRAIVRIKIAQKIE